MSTLQTGRKEKQDFDLDDSTPQINPLEVVNTFHKPNLINRLMYVLVQVNGGGYESNGGHRGNWVLFVE